MKRLAWPLGASEATSYRTAAVLAFRLFKTNLANTRAWKVSMKQARKTYCLDLPLVASTVVLGLVDHGEIIGHFKLSAISDAGIAQALASGPIIAMTLSCEISRWATAAA